MPITLARKCGGGEVHKSPGALLGRKEIEAGGPWQQATLWLGTELTIEEGADDYCVSRAFHRCEVHYFRRQPAVAVRGANNRPPLIGGEPRGEANRRRLDCVTRQ